MKSRACELAGRGSPSHIRAYVVGRTLGTSAVRCTWWSHQKKERGEATWSPARGLIVSGESCMQMMRFAPCNLVSAWQRVPHPLLNAFEAECGGCALIPATKASWIFPI